MDKHLFLSKVTAKYPSYLQRYNYDSLPGEFASKDKIPIYCYRHGFFSPIAAMHLSAGTGCRECGYERIAEALKNHQSVTTEEFIHRSKMKFNDRFDYSLTKYTRKEGELIITCPLHGDFSIRACAHLWSKHGCPKCDKDLPNISRREKYLEKARSIHGERYDYSKVVMVGFKKKVEVGCKVHGSFHVNLYMHLYNQSGCPKCVVEADRLQFSEFVERATKIHGGKYGYSPSEYVNGSSKTSIICPKHGKFRQKACSHLTGYGCKKCGDDKQRSSELEFIEASKKIYGDRFDYSRVRYRNNKQKVELICAEHGPFFVRPDSHLYSGTGCRFCSESKGERAVSLYLDNLGVEYSREYKIRPHPYRFDFYIPVANIFIEYNGLQHYRPIEMFGGLPAFLVVRKNDDIKKMLVKNLGGALVTIPYVFQKQEDIDRELKRALKKLYRYWLAIDGKIEVFKTKLSLCQRFGVRDLTLSDEELVSIIRMTDPDIRVVLS